MITIFEKRPVDAKGQMEDDKRGNDRGLINVARNHVCELLTFFVQVCVM